MLPSKTSIETAVQSHTHTQTEPYFPGVLKTRLFLIDFLSFSHALMWQAGTWLPWMHSPSQLIAVRLARRVEMANM